MMRLTAPETLLQLLRVVHKLWPHVEVVVKHVVEDAEEEVPLQGFCKHEMASGAWQGNMQGENALVQHANEVIILPHDAADNIMLCQVPHKAQPGGLLSLSSRFTQST
jgi:hypothetical protein